MSYNSDFHSLFMSQATGECSLGCFVLMSATNLDRMVADAASIPSDPMAHVLAYQENRLRSHVARVFAQDSVPVCPPPAAKAAVADLAVPAVVGQGVGTTKRLSNLDCHSKLVKRGRKVSYQGLRGLVVRVSRGRCLVGYTDAFDRFTGTTEWLICERLQVVA